MAKRYKSKKYYVSGMHCQACELLVKNKLEESPDIKCAAANLADKTVSIEYKSGAESTLEAYNKLLKNTGYTLQNEPTDRATWDSNSILVAMLVVGLLAMGYLYVKSQGYLAYASVTETSSLPAFFVFGVVAGLSSCAALVGGLLLSLSKQWTNLYAGSGTFARRSTPFVMFNAGRLISYAVLGGLLGLVGAALQLSITTTALLTLLVSFLMIVVALQMLGVSWAKKIRLQLPSRITQNLSSSKNFQGKYMPFLAGAGTFFLPCGFTLLAQTIALTTGSFLTSAAIMTFFALGTLPPLLGISLSSVKFQNNPTYAGTFNLVVGLVILAFGAFNINSQLVVLGLPNASIVTASKNVVGALASSGLDANGLGSEIIDKNGKEHQNVYFRASRFEYYPRSLNLEAGVPTTMTIESEGVVGCAQAMSLRGLYDDVVFLNRPRQEISFIPKPGTYYISCTMGMVDPVVVTVI